MYSGYAITFDSGGSWNFNNEIARNVIIFGVDNSSTSHSDNRKDNFLILGEGSTFGINGNFGSKKKICINLLKQTQNVVKVRIIMLTIVICLLMEKKSLNLKSPIKMLTFQWI